MCSVVFEKEEAEVEVESGEKWDSGGGRAVQSGTV